MGSGSSSSARSVTPAPENKYSADVEKLLRENQALQKSVITLVSVEIDVFAISVLHSQPTVSARAHSRAALLFVRLRDVRLCPRALPACRKIDRFLPIVPLPSPQQTNLLEVKASRNKDRELLAEARTEIRGLESENAR
jgi:hypothetical protein